MLGFAEALTLTRDVLGLQAGFADTVLHAPGAAEFAVLVLVLAGASEAAGESVVLFLNRVKRSHFLRSLVISAIIYAFTYAFLAASVWAVARLWLRPDAALGSIALVIAVSQAPRLFGFLAFLPYFGLPVSVLLWIWSLLAATLGVAELMDLGPREAALTIALGGLLLLTLQRTVGRPLLALARLARRRAAGVDLVTDRRQLLALVDDAPEAGLDLPPPDRASRPT